MSQDGSRQAPRQAPRQVQHCDHAPRHHSSQSLFHPAILAPSPLAFTTAAGLAAASAHRVPSDTLQSITVLSAVRKRPLQTRGATQPLGDEPLARLGLRLLAAVIADSSFACAMRGCLLRRIQSGVPKPLRPRGYAGVSSLPARSC